MQTLTQRESNVVDDINYLIDEIQSLSGVISSIPVHERPGDDFSICEIFGLIDFAQTIYFLPYLLPEAKVPLTIATASEIFESYKKQRLSKEKEIEKGISAVLLSLVENRQRILPLLAEKIRLSATIPDQSEMIISMAEAIVSHERNLLRHIADQILSLKREDQHA
jgi:hypothetical protein